MLADLIIKIVEKLFDTAMQMRDDEKLRLHEYNRMLTNRARLSGVDEAILSYIEEEAPLTVNEVAEKFNVECVGKRLSLFGAFGFISIDNDIIMLDPVYKPIAQEIAHNAVHEVVVVNVDKTVTITD